MSIPAKKPKTYNLLKTKIILNIKMSAKGGPDFTLSLPGGRLTLPFISYATAYKFHGFIIFPSALREIRHVAMKVIPSTLQIRR